MNYIAEIQHSKETFQRLAKVQHNEYGIPFKLVMIAVGTIALLAALSMGADSVYSILLLLIGGLAFSGLNTPAQRNAEKLVSLANGSFPHTKYVFLEKTIHITSEETSSMLQYHQIYDLLEDAEYFYLFLNTSAGYMVPKASVRPANEEAFTAMLEERIGLKRHRATHLLTLNFRARMARNKARRKRVQALTADSKKTP